MDEFHQQIQAAIRCSIADVIITLWLLPYLGDTPADRAQAIGMQHQASANIPPKNSFSGAPPPQRSGLSGGAAYYGGQFSYNDPNKSRAQ